VNLRPEESLPPPDFARLKALHLVVWFEYASTLAIFDRVGMLDRELAIYRRLRPHLRALTLITWSRGEDAAYIDRLGDIGLVHNKHEWTWPAWMAILLATFGLRFPGSRLIKTNQMSGARHILRVAKFWRTNLVARCGYPWSLFAMRERGPDDPVTREAIATERSVFRGAAHVVGSTEEIAKLAIERDGVPQAHVSIVPNYVDTDLLSPGPSAPRTKRMRIGFLGRFEKQKNPLALIEAVAGHDVELVMIGEGSLRHEMAALGAKLGIDLKLPGNMPHRDLPEFFRGLDLFILPSLFEGHPKALLEAMSCGLAVIGADSPGIREVLRDGDTGLLTAPDALSIRNAIDRILGDRDFAARLGRNARDEILRTVSLDRTIERELRVLSFAARPA
jgi:glycosyltransferase involved in cell wall biosynthesis